jgi:hypothetical protein
MCIIMMIMGVHSIIMIDQRPIIRMMGLNLVVVDYVFRHRDLFTKGGVNKLEESL